MTKSQKLGQEVASLKIALSTLQNEQSRGVLNGESGMIYSTPIKYLIGIINEKQAEYKEAKAYQHAFNETYMCS